MSSIGTLLSLELRSLYGINKLLHTKDKKAKSRYMLLSLVWIMLIAMVFAYVGGLVYGLCTLGLGSIVPAYLTVFASLLILAFGFFKAGNRIFGQKGYDILASMPLKSDSIVLSRFLAMYAEDLLLSLVIMLPGIAVYGLIRKPNILFYLFAIVGTVFIPAIPWVISTLIGAFIMAVSSRMKNKSMVQTVLMVLLVVGIMLGSFRMEKLEENFSPEMLSELAQTISDVLGQIYPPALWLNEAMVYSNLLKLVLFVFVSAAVMVFTIFFVSKKFHSIQHRLNNYTAKHDYKIGVMESRSLLKALCIREAKRYFSSSIYVTNTIIGPIMGTIIAVALCVSGVNMVKNTLPIEIDIAGLLPFAFAAVFCMMTTTSTAISMEGKQFWVVKSLPIPTKVLLDSKILLNLGLMLPFYAVSEIAMIIALKPDVVELIWLLFIPADLILFAVVFGITVNLKFHSFDWEKEEAVVKQGLSSMLGGFSGFFMAVFLGAITFIMPDQFADAAKFMICLLILAGTVLLYQKNNQVRLEDL